MQNALAKATVKELATLHGTKYTYGPGATTICESRVATVQGARGLFFLII